MDTPKKSRFDLSQMGEADKHNLTVTFYDAVMRFYDDPANRARFEEWMRQKSRTENLAGGSRLHGACAVNLP